MSGFFGSVLTDRTGKFSRQDDFANLQTNESSASYDFEDTYDGLGDQLQETGDDLNDDTFGAVDVGKDFDFAAQTPTTTEKSTQEQSTTTQQQQYLATTDRPLYTRNTSATGQAGLSTASWGTASAQGSTRSDSIWGHPALPSIQQSGTYSEPVRGMEVRSSFSRAPVQSRKYQTLEEVEAAMLSASRAEPQHPTPPIAQQPVAGAPSLNHLSHAVHQMGPPPGVFSGPNQFPAHPSFPQAGRNLPPGMSQGLQNLSIAQSDRVTLPPMQLQVLNSRKPVPNSTISAEDNAETLRLQQQRNLRRAQKIGHMARYNGLMSNGDKNYVLKVQISQLVSEDPEADDFYFTVHSALRGKSTVLPGPGHLQMTYLARPGQSNRRGNREKQNPMLKMQQQVQKIIASAKSRPKSTSLAMEGSLGKLSFSRVRQPKQVLNVKLPESSAPLHKQSKKEALQNIESVYNTLLLLEQTGRQNVPDSEAPPHDVWEKQMKSLTEQIWSSLHIMDSVDDSQLHPFIQLLQHVKGQKLIPRLYRSFDTEKRLTLVTMIVAHLDTLDVVRQARFMQSGVLPAEVREDIELFSQIVLPPLLVFASLAPMKIVVGLLNMLLERNNINLLCTSKIGLSFMTMFISRAEIVKQAEQADSAELEAWQSLYNKFFGIMDGRFGHIFPPVSQVTDEIYPWQFLAACAVSASPEQQHSLVNQARDRVLDNVQSSKSLPLEVSEIKRANVNLFLNAIGLDASQLDG